MSAVEFTQVARALQAEAGARGLKVPAFRSPCTVGTRSIRRTRAGQVVVLVSHIGRDAIDVASDLIDGVLAANGLEGSDAELVRPALWQAAGLAVGA